MNNQAIDIKNSDVLVIGAGTAGIGAAIAAARKGLKVYLLESSNKIGGVMSSCPGMPLGAGYPCGKSIGGIFDEFVNRLYDMKPPAAEKRVCSLEEFGPEVLYDHEIAIFTLYEMLAESNVNLLLNATATDVIVEDNRVNKVVYYDRNGKHIINCKIVIDCSGDGDIASKAGVPYIKGDENGNMMGTTLTFLMINADWKKIFDENDDPYFRKYAEKGILEGRIHEDLYKLYIMKGFHKDSVYFNSVVIRDVDGTNVEDVTKATFEARKRCHQLIEFVKNEIPGFENSQAIYMGPVVGVRETRKFDGLYQITRQDIAKGEKFCDGIVACDNPIDDVFRGSNVMTHDSIGDKGLYYTIPFRTMVPESIKNLMFAGRIISADSVAFASVRGMPQCMIMGQACGIAASISIKNDQDIQSIEYDELVKELQLLGVNGIGGEEL